MKRNSFKAGKFKLDHNILSTYHFLIVIYGFHLDFKFIDFSVIAAVWHSKVIHC